MLQLDSELLWVAFPSVCLPASPGSYSPLLAGRYVCLSLPARMWHLSRESGLILYGREVHYAVARRRCHHAEHQPLSEATATDDGLRLPGYEPENLESSGDAVAPQCRSDP